MTRILFAISALFVASALNAQTPVIVDGGILNGASFARNQAVAPGSLVSIFGDNLASQLASASSIPFSVALAGVSVTFNTVSAPMSDVIPGSATSRSQLNVQVPWDAIGGLPQGSVAVVVTRDGQKSAPQQLSLNQFAPGIFTIPAGAGYLIASNADGSVAAPVGAIPGITTHPAKVGDGIFFYANGLGPVDSAIQNGAASTDVLRKTLTTPTVIIDGISVTPFFSGLAPQFPGVNQVNFTIPAGVHSGNVQVQLSIGGITTSQTATIAVQ